MATIADLNEVLDNIGYNLETKSAVITIACNRGLISCADKELQDMASLATTLSILNDKVNGLLEQALKMLTESTSELESTKIMLGEEGN